MESPSGERMDRIIGFVYKCNPLYKINIAGNGIYSLPKPQSFYSDWVYQFLKAIEFSYPLNKIISGGQTGIDEAGIIAADRLGYDCEVNAPKGWRFRTREGEVRNEQLFKQRFYSC